MKNWCMSRLQNLILVGFKISRKYLNPSWFNSSYSFIFRLFLFRLLSDIQANMNTDRDPLDAAERFLISSCMCFKLLQLLFSPFFDTPGGEQFMPIKAKRCVFDFLVFWSIYVWFLYFIRDEDTKRNLKQIYTDKFPSMIVSILDKIFDLLENPGMLMYFTIGVTLISLTIDYWKDWFKNWYLLRNILC